MRKAKPAEAGGRRSCPTTRPTVQREAGRCAAILLSSQRRRLRPCRWTPLPRKFCPDQYHLGANLRALPGIDDVGRAQGTAQEEESELLLASPSRAAAEMQAASRRGTAAAAAAAVAGFHSTAAVALSKSTPRIQFNVREKRTDAKNALKNILLNGGPFQERSNKQTKQQKAGGKSKVRPGSGNNPHRRVHDWRNFDDDDCSDSPYGSFGGKASFTWYWPGEDEDLGSTNGFQWRDQSQSTKSRERVWNESDVDEEEQPFRDDLKSHRLSLGLPALGPLKLDRIKSAFRALALRWHPDKHQGSSQDEAEEKFRRCVEAYNTLAAAYKSVAK
ncbi:hypothetical protein ACQ4PT_013335 [Festuca glaucescens]